MPEAADLVRLRAEYARREKRLSVVDTYSLFNPANLFLVQHRQRAILQSLRQHGLYPLNTRPILEVGCGQGGVLSEFLNCGASLQNLAGIDLLFDRLRQAHSGGLSLRLACADGQNLPYPTGYFDLVLQFTVFSSLLDATVKANFAREMLRVLGPAGVIMWYDFWFNPTNPQTKGIRPAEIRQLFPDCQIIFQRITLAPPIARKLVGVSWALCSLLERLQIFNSHYLATIQRDH